MNNQEILIIVLIAVLIVIRFFNKYFEPFTTEPAEMLCRDYPFNSNCNCPPDAPVQTVLGEFPMNYGEKSPYVYTCVPTSTSEPSTNLWPNPK